MRIAAEEFLHPLAHARHAGLAADEHDIGDVLGFEAGVLERLLARVDGALDEVPDELFELGAGERLDEVQRGRGAAFHAGGDERLVDLGRRRRAQFDLGLLGGFLEALQREAVGAKVDILLRLEAVGEPIDDARVEILAAEEGVAVGRLHLEHAVADLEHRHVEGAAAEVVDGDRLAVVLLEAVGERGRGRLVDDAQHFKAGDLAGVLGRLALGVVEVSGNGDHRLGDGLAEIGLGGFLHLLEDEGRDLRRAVILAAGVDPGVAVRALDDLVGHQLGVLLGDRIVEAAADQALDRENRIVGVGDRLALGRLADQPLTVLGEGDDRRRGARALAIFDDLRLAAFHHGDAAVGRAQVDPDDLGHISSPLSSAPSSSPVEAAEALISLAI